MTSEHEEVKKETYLEQLQRQAQVYITWASRFGSTVTEQQEAEMLEQARVGSSEMWQSIAKGDFPEADRGHLEEMEAAAEELDGSVEGTKTYMERITAAFQSASEWTQQNLVEPLCNFFKSLYEGACKVCNQVGEKLGFFSNTEGEEPTDDQDLEHGDDGQKPEVL